MKNWEINRISLSSFQDKACSAEGRTMEGLSSSLAIAMTWKILSDVKKGNFPTTESDIVLSEWLKNCNVGAATRSTARDKVTNCSLSS